MGQHECEIFDLSPDSHSGVEPVIFVPGLGKTLLDYKATLFELYKRGHRILSITPPTLDESKLGVNNGSPSLQMSPPIFQLRAEALQKLCATKGLVHIDVVTHSEGILHAVIAAGKDATLFRNFVFIAPPGFATHSAPTILKRALSNAVQGMTSERRNQPPLSSPRPAYSMKNAKAVIGSVIYPGQVSIIDEVQSLRDQGHQVAVIAYEDDWMLPLAEFKKILVPSEDGMSPVVDRFGSLPGTHDGLRESPKVSGLHVSGVLATLQGGQTSLQEGTSNRYRV